MVRSLLLSDIGRVGANEAPSAVYLDNHKAVDELLLNELSAND